MKNAERFYIDGQWVAGLQPRFRDVINPATEAPVCRLAMGCAADVDAAVAAATRALPAYRATPALERLAMLKVLREVLVRRADEIANAITLEMGAPVSLSLSAQFGGALANVDAMIRAAQGFEYEERLGTTLLTREPIGVVGLITPWNWPLNQVVCKAIPALAAGCTVVMKPSEVAPLDAIIFAEAVHEAGFPPGVFNLVNGDGPDVGEAISRHPGIRMVSFTGSTRAGTLVTKASAETVKRVTLELGGKSPNLILADADVLAVVEDGVRSMMTNSGQTCDAPTHMLVPAAFYQDALAAAGAVADSIVVGDPSDPQTQMGPVVNKAQFEKIQDLIASGVAEGALLVAGGTGRPDHLAQGYYIKPTIFGNVSPQMRVLKEEIFGPVLVISSYESEAQAVQIANDTEYGLAAYVHSRDLDHARAVGRQLEAGSVFINYADWDYDAPFGGFKQSGNGREGGIHGMAEYFEIKANVGYFGKG
ncbi:aldehyde dehydrogenase family protein [Pseudomonas putida]